MARERKILQLVSNEAQVRESLLPSWVAIQQQRPVTWRNYLCMLLSATTFTAPRQSPFAQTLILKSRHDRLINSRCSDQIAAAWQVELQEHTTAGHDLSSDDPHWIVAADSCLARALRAIGIARRGGCCKVVTTSERECVGGIARCLVET